MKTKQIFASILVFSFLFSFNALSQENKIGIQIETGYGLKLSREDYNTAQFYITPFYKLNDNLLLGAGIGLIYNHRNTAIQEANTNFSIPVYGSAEYIFSSNSKIKPFINTKIGYGLMSKKYETEDFSHIFTDNNDKINVKYSGGYFISPAIGLLYPINNGHSLKFSLSYDLQKLKMILSGSGSKQLKSFHTNSTLSLKVGWSF
ncbi:MAG: hypothetical protein Q4G63_11445 [Bacteroidia bacterium]|nr:hypothetical protein [Bacteroidia bacterium]